MKIIRPDITSALSQEGIFFQMWCAEQIRSSGWGILGIDFPFTYPPSSDISVGKQGVLDIYAYTKLDNYDDYVCTLVECKKAHPNYKTWIFFGKSSKDNLGFVWIRERQEDAPTKFRISFSGLYFPSSPTLAYEGREVQINSGKVSRGRNEDNRIQYASQQVSHALRGIIEEMSRTGSLGLRKYSAPSQFTIPVIVTSAQLYTCQYLPSDVTQLGDIDHEKVDYKEVEWVTYEYPLPDYLKLTHSDFADRKRLIIIVNSAHVKKLFDELKLAIISDPR